MHITAILQRSLSDLSDSYWTKDINKINPHYGSEDTLIELINALHDRKMFVMVDVVVNQYAKLFLKLVTR